MNLWKRVCRKKWKAALLSGGILLFSAVSIAAFQEAAVIFQAATGKVEVHLEEYAMKDGKEVKWTDGQQVMPGGILSKIPRICNDGEPCYVRVKVDFESTKEASVPLTAENLEGIPEQWVQRGEYFYYKEVLPKDGRTDFFQGIRMPAEWESGEDDDNGWKAKVRVDAIQAAFFEPDFSDEDPWRTGDGEVKIRQAVEEKPVDQEKNSEPVKLEVAAGMKGFSADTQEFFRGMETFVPGKSQTGEVKLTNPTGTDREVFVKAEILEENDLLDVLELTVQLRKEDHVRIIYQGALNARELETYKSIGVIEGGSEGKVEFLVHMPAEADNYYSARQGKVKFWFTTDVPENEKMSENVKTGDETPVVYILVLFGLSCISVLVFVGVRRKKHGKKMS